MESSNLFFVQMIQKKQTYSFLWTWNLFKSFLLNSTTSEASFCCFALEFMAILWLPRARTCSSSKFLRFYQYATNRACFRRSNECGARVLPETEVSAAGVARWPFRPAAAKHGRWRSRRRSLSFGAKSRRWRWRLSNRSRGFALRRLKAWAALDRRRGACWRLERTSSRLILN